MFNDDQNIGFDDNLQFSEEDNLQIGFDDNVQIASENNIQIGNNDSAIQIQEPMTQGESQFSEQINNVQNTDNMQSDIQINAEQNLPSENQETTQSEAIFQEKVSDVQEETGQNQFHEVDLPKDYIPIVKEVKVDDQPKKDLTKLSRAEKTMDEIFQFVRKYFGSDLHINADDTPKVRVFGEIHEIPGYNKFSQEEVLELIYSTMEADIKKEYQEEMDADYSYLDARGMRYRANAYQAIYGAGAVFRTISNRILSFDELGLPESLKKIANYKKGLVLVTGPTGSGKSTTLASLIELVNETQDGHILTIEDPVEVLHKSKKSLVNHREIKTHTKSFPRALRSALREDPDVIMIGEMRDLETISLAITAAETGHLVFGTLHTASASKTISRIVDVFPSGEQGQIRSTLSGAMQCVVSQVLCKKADGKGLVAAYEIMFGTPAVKNLIRSDKIFQIPSAIEMGVKQGMQLLDQSLSLSYRQGLITLEEAKTHAKYPNELIGRDIRK